MLTCVAGFERCAGLLSAILVFLCIQHGIVSGSNHTQALTCFIRPRRDRWPRHQKPSGVIRHHASDNVVVDIPGNKTFGLMMLC